MAALNIDDRFVC